MKTSLFVSEIESEREHRQPGGRGDGRENLKQTPC